jgi:GTPase
VKVGDEIYIIGNETGVIRTKIDRIEIEHKSVDTAKRGMLVGIKVSNCRRGDEVFLIEKT